MKEKRQPATSGGGVRPGVDREEGEIAMTTELTGWASVDENVGGASGMPAETLRNKESAIGECCEDEDRSEGR